MSGELVKEDLGVPCDRGVVQCDVTVLALDASESGVEKV